MVPNQFEKIFRLFLVNFFDGLVERLELLKSGELLARRGEDGVSKNTGIKSQQLSFHPAGFRQLHGLFQVTFVLAYTAL